MNIKIDNEYMQMQQALQSQYSSINVQNTNSDLNRFYHMNVPFQLTLSTAAVQNWRITLIS